MRTFEDIVVTKPWGYEYLVYQNSQAAVWLLCLNSGKRTSLHKHERKVTQLIVISGDLNIKVENKNQILTDGEFVVIKRNTPHQTENQSMNSAYLIEIEYPNDKLDLVRISDDFGREGQGYEKQSEFVARRLNHDYIDFADFTSNSVISKRINDTRVHFFYSDFNFARKALEDLSSTDFNYFNLEEWTNSTKSEKSLKFHEVSDEENKLNEKHTFLVIEQEVKKVPGYDKLADGIINVFGGVVFGTLGDASLHFGNHAARVENIEIDLYVSDRTASLAAEGHSFVSQICTILFVSSENGFIDCLKAINNCMKDKTPLVVLRFSPNSHENKLVQFRPTKQIDSPFFSLNLFKAAEELTEQEFSSNNLNKALTNIRNNFSNAGPGPCLLSIPLEVLTRWYPKEKQEPHNDVKQSIVLDVGDLSQNYRSIVDTILSSERPLLVLGRGVRIECTDLEISNFLNLLDKLKIPVVSTRSGIDLLTNMRLNNFGRVGTYGMRYSNLILHEAETILFLGTSLSQAQTGKNPSLYGEKAHKILIGSDAVNPNSEIRGYDYNNLKVAGFVKYVSGYKSSNLNPKSDWFEYCTYLRSNFSQQTEIVTEGMVPSIGEVIRNVTLCADNNSMFCVDGGSLLHNFTQNAVIGDKMRVVNSSIMEATGISFASSLGVSYFAEKTLAPTIAISDSFGIQENMSHIEDIREKNRRIKFVFLSEEIKNRNWNHNFLYPGSSVGRSIPSGIERVKKIWTANGLPYIKVSGTDVASLEKLLKSEERSMLIEIPVSGTDQLIPRVSYDRSVIGTFKQKALTEMEPKKCLPSFMEFKIAGYR